MIDYRKLGILSLLSFFVLLYAYHSPASPTSINESSIIETPTQNDEINSQRGNTLRSIQSIEENHGDATSVAPEIVPTTEPNPTHEGASSTARNQRAKSKGAEMATRMEEILLTGNQLAYCTALDNYVLNRSERLPLPIEQHMSEKVEIPDLGIIPTDEIEMEKRRLLAEKGCRIKERYNQLKHLFWNDQDRLFEELRLLQEYVKSEKTVKEFENDKTLMLPFTGSQLRTIFFLEDYKMIPCLPLKTGTTNWQRALVSLLYAEDGKPKLDPNDVVKNNLYKEIPRYSQRYNQYLFPRQYDSTKVPCLRKSLRRVVDDPDYTRWINVRHPMSRLLSAWNQKFDLQFDGLNIYLQYVKKIVKFERPEYEKNNHLVSLEAFSDYVAHLEDDNAYNEHWKSYWHCCSPCVMNYQYIVKQESSAGDSQFILQKMNLDKLTYLPGQYNNSLVKSHGAEDYFVNTSKSTIKKLYNIFFMDFVMYNYTIDEFL